MQKKLMALVALIATIFLGSCGDNVNEKMDEYKNGDFKLDVRSREFNNSGIHNVEVCVANTSQKDFPENKLQCFFSGYDFSNFSVKWLSGNEIEIAFSCGRVSHFNNYAVVSADARPPSQFHVRMLDRCSQQP